MRTLLKVALLLIAGILVYNYFFGSTEEKAGSEKVFKQVKEVGKSIGELISSEKEKFEDGKYDKAFDNLNKIYDNLKEKVNDINFKDEKAELKKLEETKDELKKKKNEIERELKKDDVGEEVIKKGEELEESLRKLVDETTALFDKVTEKEKE